MGSLRTNDDLKSILRTELRAFCATRKDSWTDGVYQTVKDLLELRTRAVFFGGALRSLLLGRLYFNRPGRPRDLDIVVEGLETDELQRKFSDFIVRRTRFGGLQLRRMNWAIDIWPLHTTWAFSALNMPARTFADLPRTTTFNIESIAATVSGEGESDRTVFSGDDQFFDAIRTRTLDLNQAENPFPDLCVVRALSFAAKYDFKVARRLAEFLVRYGRSMNADQYEFVQCRHYGRTLRSGETMLDWVRYLDDSLESSEDASFKLPMARQLKLWPDLPEHWD
jgi:hypothetical protein